MLAVDYYDVRISSSDGEIVSEKVNNATTLLFNHSFNHSVILFTINVTVVDTKGQRSTCNSVTIVKNIGMQNTTPSK